MPFFTVEGNLHLWNRGANRKGFPIELQQLKASALARGASQLRVFDGVVAMTWKDNKIVHFLSTIHSPDETSTILRQQRARGTGEYILAEIPSYKIVESYNANMGAVDTKWQGSDHTCEVCREKYRRYKVSHGNCADRLNPCKRTKTTFKCSACDVYLVHQPRT